MHRALTTPAQAYPAVAHKQTEAAGLKRQQAGNKANYFLTMSVLSQLLAALRDFAPAASAVQKTQDVA
jgi:hypothetical protein